MDFPVFLGSSSIIFIKMVTDINYELYLKIFLPSSCNVQIVQVSLQTLQLKHIIMPKTVHVRFTLSVVLLVQVSIKFYYF